MFVSTLDNHCILPALSSVPPGHQWTNGMYISVLPRILIRPGGAGASWTKVACVMGWWPLLGQQGVEGPGNKNQFLSLCRNTCIVSWLSSPNVPWSYHCHLQIWVLWPRDSCEYGVRTPGNEVTEIKMASTNTTDLKNRTGSSNSLFGMSQFWSQLAAILERPPEARCL